MYKLIMFVIILLLPLICVCNVKKSENLSTTNTLCERIVSLAPSITETLFALGCGNKVVGITDYCSYPPQVKTNTRLGGYLNPNYELLLGIKPCLVILVKEHTSVKDFLKKNNVPFLEIDNHNLESIIRSFELIGQSCGQKLAADSLVQLFRKETIDATVTVNYRPRILFCIGRDDLGAGFVTKAFVAGRNTFYDELIKAAGGINAINDSLVKYPSISSEAILRIRPDIIIDVMASRAPNTHQKMKDDWKNLMTLPAVKNNMVFCITEEYATIPGPRLLLLLQELKKIINIYHSTQPDPKQN